MIKNEIVLSPEFKKQATKSVLSIILFVTVYTILFVLSIALTVICVMAGIGLITSAPGLITIALGIGLASLGFLVFVFLIKFIFKSHKIDRSYLIEIKEEDEPELFEMIKDIVDKVGSKFPKRVYLSNEVNASVFYDSSFWSMFFPTKKNLLIGVGLVNMMTEDELKAILSHEFGHFSQRTMKVGSYVYNVNQVIFNMLYDNDSYDNLMQKWAEVSGYFSIFVFLASLIVRIIQWVLQMMYSVVNKSYMGLSREMEFHADEIASHVTGFKPLKTSLLRSEIANFSFNHVLSFYDSKVNENIKSENIYCEQRYVANFLSEKIGIPILNGLPNVTLEYMDKLNKSKLVIKDQWSSHPTNEERIINLEKGNVLRDGNSEKLARGIFREPDALEQKMTDIVFSAVQYEKEPSAITLEAFIESYEKEYLDNIFATEYKGYYDNHNPASFDLNNVIPVEDDLTLDALYSEASISINEQIQALKSDKETLELIKNKTIKIKTFDYDGIKYKAKKAKDIINEIDQELVPLEKQSKDHDMFIYSYFVGKTGNDKLKKMYSNLFSFDQEFEQRMQAYIELSEKTEFINFRLSIEEIQSKILLLEAEEIRFKRNLNEIINDPKFESEISPEMKESFELYQKQKLKYFNLQTYNEDNLQILFLAMNNYVQLISRGYFVTKRELLDYQLELLN